MALFVASVQYSITCATFLRTHFYYSPAFPEPGSKYQLQQQLEDKNLEKFQPGVIFLGVNLNKDIDYPTVFAMAVLKSALFTVVATAAEGMSTAKFSLVGIKQIVEAKVRQEGYIQWLSLMKHRGGNISANPLRIEANRKKFSKRWCKSPFPMILQDDTHFQWVPWAS